MNDKLKSDRSLIVRTRIAPSPTGYWHIGNIRTALFNYLFARKNNGKFILRIEDTDRERYIEDAVNYIIDSVKWLGLVVDEGPENDGPFGPYVQSERLDLYNKHANELLEKGLAYNDNGAIRFRTIKDGSTTWNDLIGSKNITFENRTQEDFIILKSDGYPTYNFANVIDDHYMEITHVIRGPEFISSTPKHIMLYNSFNWEIPSFGHTPVILGPDKAKLSKRHGAKAVLEFKKEGYLPEALLNYIAFLGWTPPSGKEILSLSEMISEFDIKDVNVSSPIFDMNKLDWVNGIYIRQMTDQNLSEQIKKFLDKDYESEKIDQLIPLVKERMKKLSDFKFLTNFIFNKPVYDKSTFDQLEVEGVNVNEVFKDIYSKLKDLSSPWDKEEFELSMRQLAVDLKITNRTFFQLIRIAISGQTITPPMFEVIQIMGENEVLDRINFVFEKYPNF